MFNSNKSNFSNNKKILKDPIKDMEDIFYNLIISNKK